MISHHDDVIKWKHFSRYWPFVRGIHQSPVNSPHKGQWRGALIFSLICVWINGWLNNGEAGDLRRYRAHYDVSDMMMDRVITPPDCVTTALVMGIQSLSDSSPNYSHFYHKTLMTGGCCGYCGTYNRCRNVLGGRTTIYHNNLSLYIFIVVCTPTLNILLLMAYITNHTCVFHNWDQKFKSAIFAGFRTSQSTPVQHQTIV